MEKIEYRELIQLFLERSIHDIKSESEVPNISFKFDENGIELFKNIIAKPFTKERVWLPSARQTDLDFLIKRSNDDCLTIEVKDPKLFFKYLTEITNSLVELYNYYGIKSSARNLAMHIMRRIWLRMGVEDINNVELFLEKQLEFTNNRNLDIPVPKKLTTYNECDVYAETKPNQTYDETTRSMIFTLKDNDEKYELPHILYDMDDNNTCYIYGVQSSKTEKSKKIERKLYKLNKGIENPNIHPSKVCAIILFINYLEQHHISKIVVPSLQVLSHRYHELLSQKAKKNLTATKNNLEVFPDDECLQDQYKALKDWYYRVYDKEDLISYLKTEELINVMYRILAYKQNIEITNEVDFQGDSLNMRIK